MDTLKTGSLQIGSLEIPYLVLLFAICVLLFIALFCLVAGLISTRYRKTHGLGKYAQADKTAVKMSVPTPEEQLEELSDLDEDVAEEAAEEEPLTEDNVETVEANDVTDEEVVLDEEANTVAAEEVEEVDVVADDNVVAAEDTEEESIAQATVFDEDDSKEEMLASMTDEDAKQALHDFDFDAVFDTLEEPVEEQPVEEAVADEQPVAEQPATFDALAATILLPGDEDEDDEEEEEEDDDEDDAGFDPNQPKYLRSFRSKLIQGKDANKRYYQVLKNELLSYKKMRSSVAWGAESFICGRKTYARITQGRKTMCVYLALDPNQFNPNVFHHRDKSEVRKYAATPLMMRITSDKALRRTLSLIVTMVADNQLVKNPAFAPVDYQPSLTTKTDEELLEMGLIKLNLRAAATVEESKTGDVNATKEPEYRQVAMVKKDQIGNMTDQDIAKLRRKEETANQRKKEAAKGKFAVRPFDHGYRFEFLDTNGNTLFVSGIFKNRNGAIKGVAAYKRALGHTETPVVFSLVDDQYIYTLRTGSRNYTSVMYPTKEAADKGLETARSLAEVSDIECE